MTLRVVATIVALALAVPAFAADWYAEELVADLRRLDGLDAPVELRRGNVPLRELYDAIEKAAGIRVFVKGPASAAPVAVEWDALTAYDTLARVTRDRGVRYEVPEPGILVARLPWPMGHPGQAGAPRLVAESKVAATYPEDARRARAGGQVVFSVVVGRDGSIVWIRAVREIVDWPSLTDAGIEALRQWRYEPATVDGEPVDALFAIVHEFSVEGP